MNFGFIVTRHVNTEQTNLYWNQCVKLLRSHYPKCQIVIIDDNSNQDFIKPEHDYKNLTIIQSEYPGRGELLPYIYFLRYRWFENAVIIHDSVFFHFTFPFEKLNRQFASLWFFGNNDSELSNIIRVAKTLKNNRPVIDCINKWDRGLWLSSQGAQSYINHNFLVRINNKYNFKNLLDSVLNRSDRCTLERIIGILVYLETDNIDTIFGDINLLYKAGNYSFDEYIDSFNNGKVMRRIAKVWTGR
jgi:hypothetical protein